MSSRSQTHLNHSSNTIALDTHNTLKTLNTNIQTLNTHNDGVEAGLTTISTNQTNGNHIVKVKGSDGSTLHGDGNGNIKCNVINSININPANSSNADHVNHSGHALAVGLRAREDIADHTSGKFLKCDSNGILSVNDSQISPLQTTLTEAELHLSSMDTNITTTRDNIASMKIFNQDAELHLSALDTNFSNRIPTTIGPKDEALSFTIARNNTVGAFDNHARTNITDRATSKALLCNSLGQLVITDAPTTYENVALTNPNNILGLSGGDSIDMNGFRNIFISCVINATTGGSCNSIFLLGSNDNSTFVITSDSFQPTEARTNGTYEAGAVYGNLGYRYLKLGSNNSTFLASVSSVVVKTNRFNGSF